MSDWGWIAAGGVGGLVLLHRMLIWCEARGWLYYGKAPHGAGGAAGAVFGELMEVLQPSRRITVRKRSGSGSGSSVSSPGPGERRGACSASRSSSRPLRVELRAPMRPGPGQERTT